MAENKSFWIKYLDNNPVEIETLYFNDQERKRPLKNVGHLISAYFPEMQPNERANYSLFMANSDGNTLEALRPGMLLAELPHSADDNPLIIKSRNDNITMDEYMVSSLPRPVYETRISRPNSSGSNWKLPKHVFSWTGFKESVVTWIGDNHQQHSQRLQRPVFISRIITEEVQSLQPFILDNLLDVAAKCFIPKSEFKSRGQIPSCNGYPDYLMTRNGNIVALIEVKGIWTVPNSINIVNDYNLNLICKSAVHQLYHYMRLNHRKYGILTTYEKTWFVYRSQECEDCLEPPGHETLYFTEGIAFTAQTPTILQCFAYFNTIVDGLPMESPPASKRPSRSNSAAQTSRNTNPLGSPGNRMQQEFSSSSLCDQLTQVQRDFDVDDFKLDTVLGQGRCKVYLDEYDSHPIALKTADVAKNEEMLPELLNEVSIYQELSELQGNGIPKLFCHGYLEDVLYCVGVSICGSVPESLTEQQKQQLHNTLENIHKAGILHNDIRKENILVDEDGNPSIIDFGFSKRTNSKEDQIEELFVLHQLIESL